MIQALLFVFIGWGFTPESFRGTIVPRFQDAITVCREEISRRPSASVDDYPVGARMHAAPK
ncbi:MAG: hypothetical protein AAF927_29640 [Bacteroidota bacterium]